MTRLRLFLPILLMLFVAAAAMALAGGCGGLGSSNIAGASTPQAADQRLNLPSEFHVHIHQPAGDPSDAQKVGIYLTFEGQVIRQVGVASDGGGGFGIGTDAATSMAKVMAEAVAEAMKESPPADAPPTTQPSGP